MEIRDAEIVIVGAGPIGIEMGLQLQRLNLDFCIVDAGQVGHTIGWYAPGTHFFSSPERIAIGGIPLITRDQGKATREEYLDYLMTVVWQHDLPVYTLTRLLSIEESGLVDMTGSESGEKYWRLNLERGGEERSIRCRFLVLAIGDMHRPRKLGIPGEEQSNVSHYLRELRNYFRQEVVIVGGRNSAVEAAIRIFRMGGKVTLLYRGKGLDGKTIKYWLYPEIESMIKNGLIRFIPEATAHQIRGNRLYYSSPGSSRDVEGTYQAAGDGNQGSFSHKSPPGKSDSDSPGDEPVRPDAKMQELEADQFLLLTGYEQDYSFLESLGLQLEGAEKRPFFDNNTMETNLSNVFIAGTATAGSQQRHTVFIENSHEHVSRIGHTILGRKPQGDGRSRSDSSAFAIQPSPGSGLFPNDIPGEGNEPGSGDALKRIYEEHPES